MGKWALTTNGLKPSKTMAGFYNSGVFPPHHPSALRDMLRDQETILLRSKSSRRASKMSIKPNQHREFYQISTLPHAVSRCFTHCGHRASHGTSSLCPKSVSISPPERAQNPPFETAIWPSISWICRKKPKTWDIPLTKRDQLVRFQQKILIWSDMYCI